METAPAQGARDDQSCSSIGKRRRPCRGREMGERRWSIKARLRIGTPTAPCTIRCRILHAKAVSFCSLPSSCQASAIHWYAQTGELQRLHREARMQSRNGGFNQDRRESAGFWLERTGGEGGAAYRNRRKSPCLCGYRTDQADSWIFRAAAAHPVATAVFEGVGGVGERSSDRVRR